MQLLRCFHADLESYCHNRHAMPLESASVIIVTTAFEISREHLNFQTGKHVRELHKLRLNIESKFFSKHEILLAFQFFRANLSKKKKINKPVFEMRTFFEQFFLQEAKRLKKSNFNYLWQNSFKPLAKFKFKTFARHTFHITANLWHKSRRF